MTTKTTFYKKWKLFLLAAITLLSCNLNQDKQIKAHINSLAKDNLNFAGVNYTVHNGTVTLFGNCPSDKTKGKVLQVVKEINVLKGIRDNVTIGPVVLGAEQQIKASIDSVLANYPLVSAEVNESKIELFGIVKQQESEKLLSAISAFGLPIEKERLKML